MDINVLGIGGILGAMLLAGINLYIFHSNRKKDAIKERLDNLYIPMYVYHMEHMRYGIKDPYKDYLELKKIYIGNSIYASDILKELFESVIYAESEFMGLDEKKRAEKMNHAHMENDKGEEKNLNSMVVRISGWIHREHDELQIYYAKGMIGRFFWRWKIYYNDNYARGTIPAGQSFN